MEQAPLAGSSIGRIVVGAIMASGDWENVEERTYGRKRMSEMVEDVDKMEREIGIQDVPRIRNCGEIV